ncbi:MAG TPA: cation:dicarboxylase symporter family transporter, partial [Prolixibacteraceae bacterium]
MTEPTIQTHNPANRPEKKKVPAKYLLSMLAVLFLVSLLNILKFYSLVEIHHSVLVISRWILIVLFLGYAAQKRSLTTWILISMIVGTEFGFDFPAISVNLNVISQIFLRLIKTIIAPLLFATIVVGIAGHSDLKQVGRMGWKSLLYFEIVSTLALVIGLFAINISKAGIGVNVPQTLSHTDIAQVQALKGSEVFLHVFPENLAKAIYEGQVLQIVIFSILFGIAVALLKDKFRRPMLVFTEALSETMFKFTSIVMYFAPFAVFAAIAFSIGQMGLEIFVNLFKLLATLYVALIVFLVGALLPIALLFKIPVRKFINAISEPVAIAFATTSSESALPLAMERMEEFGVPRKIVAFVMPTGYSFNLDGTTLYLSLATIFVAQISGIDLPIGKQILIVFTLMLTSKGVAAVPRASLVILLATASSFGLPIWPIYIILGIDELMDMARTSVNVIGNCLATVVIARWENEYPPK